MSEAESGIKSFSDFGITMKKSFVGTKKYIEDILDQEIIVEFYEIRPSTKNDGTNCLYLQIKLQGNSHVIFSSSSYLMDTLRINDQIVFPFKTHIAKINRHYEFK